MSDKLAHTSDSDLLRIHKDSFEQSPYLECYDRSDIIFGVYEPVAECLLVV